MIAILLVTSASPAGRSVSVGRSTVVGAPADARTRQPQDSPVAVTVPGTYWPSGVVVVGAAVVDELEPEVLEPPGTVVVTAAVVVVLVGAGKSASGRAS